MTNASYRPSKPDEIKERYVGQSIDVLPTPAILIDRAKMLYNIQEMQRTIDAWHCLFRVHIKTHKTAEATRMQLANAKEGAIIVSTLAEAWGVLNSKDLLTGSSRVRSILYGVPISIDRIAELLDLRERFREYDVDVLLLVDHVIQVDALDRGMRQRCSTAPISVYIKIDSGYRRAGLTSTSPLLPELVETIIKSDHVAIWGMYCHAGHAYGSSNTSQAEAIFGEEIKSVNEAAKIVKGLLQSSGKHERHRQTFVLSVGCTPTAHAARTAISSEALSKISEELEGELEIHAGNYSFLDLQQVATGAISDSRESSIHRCALTVLATVISSYPGRGSDGIVQARTSEVASDDDEALCNAGGIALSKDTGPIPGYGYIISPEEYRGWKIARIAQEHGIMTLDRDGPVQAHGDPRLIQIGDRIQIIPQHACMVAAAHPNYFVIDSSRGEDVPIIEDVWFPWKGW